MKQTFTVGFVLALAAASPCCADPGAGRCAMAPVVGAMTWAGGPVAPEAVRSPRDRLARLAAAPQGCTPARTGSVNVKLMSFRCAGVSA